MPQALYDSPYQHFKNQMLEWLPLAKDAYHIYIGVGAFLLTGLLTKRRYSSAFCLVPGLALSLLLEAIDLHDDYYSIGRLQWGESLHDVLITNALPMILYLTIRLANDKFRK
jgi:hypothetical protein